MSEFIDQLQKDYGSWGKVCNINDFMTEVIRSLSENDFKKENSRLVFSVCPDDINRLEQRDTIEKGLKKEYDSEFHLGGLGAYPIGGVSGITAASHHPPDNLKGGERKDGNLIFFISPHVGLMKKDDFIYGKIIRPGQEKITSSCGAMIGFLNQLKQDGSPENFKIAADTTNTDPTRIVLHQELINNYTKELNDILTLENDNQQVVELFKLNYNLVANKGKEMIKQFLEKEKDHFKGDIAVLGGITVNHSQMDNFVLKEMICPFK